LRIIRAIVGGERDPAALAALRDYRCKASEDTVRQALVGDDREEHVFALAQAVELYDTYQAKVAACDARIEAVLNRLQADCPVPAPALPAPRYQTQTHNALAFPAREALHRILGVDLTQIHGLGPYLALKLVGECGTSLAAWPSAKHFTSWLCLAPSNKISGGKVLSAKTRRSNNRAAALLRLAAVAVGRTETALGAFYRRLSGRVGKAKAVTATARKIAVLFYNTLRHGMAYTDPGASYYEERYRQRVLANLRRRAKSLGYLLQATIKPVITAPVTPGTLVHTDEYSIYARLPAWGYEHKTVCHARGEYARDEDGDGFCEVLVNTMEGFWSLLRSWLRPHRGISQDKLPLYLGFFQFVHNARQRGKALLGALITGPVT